MKTHLEVLLVTKGHVFEREPFFQLIDELEYLDNDVVINWTHVEQPAAGSLLNSEQAADYDAIVFYDMPGVTFTRDDPPFTHVDPSNKYKADFLDLVESGKGMVFLHHAIASWPSWPEFAQIVGGRFHFLPGQLGGKQYTGSGYRFKTRQVVSVIDTDHPITKGIDPEFEIVDEAYLFPVLEDEVQPLLRSDFSFEADQFHMGGVGFKDHPPGSNLLGWTKLSGNSPITYLQMGHGPSIYADANFKKLLFNSIRWVCNKSEEINDD